MSSHKKRPCKKKDLMEGEERRDARPAEDTARMW